MAEWMAIGILVTAAAVYLARALRQSARGDDSLCGGHCSACMERQDTPSGEGGCPCTREEEDHHDEP